MARLAAAVAVALVLGVASAEAANGIRPHVSPASGSPSTTFTVSFVAPARTGVTGSMRLVDEVTVSNPATASGCTASATRLAPVVHRGELVHVALRPAASMGWCAGTFTGKVVEFQTVACPPLSLCPMDERLRAVGTFTFFVR